MRRALIGFVVVVLVCVGLIWLGEFGWGPVVITRENEQKMILFLGDPRAVTEPGVTLRLPLLEEEWVFDRRLLYLNAEPDLIQTRDQERILVDNYVVWRIVDPGKFFASFPGGMTQAEHQIDRVIRAGVREVIGQHTLTEVLTGERLDIMRVITEQANAQLGQYGIEAEDVRINRTELPRGAEKNVFARMQTDRQRLARKYRAEGGEKARRIRAEADREARVIVAHARRDAEITRGEGDAESTRIYAEAYVKAPGFYAFLRSLEAYRKTIGDGTTLVVSPDTEFFQFFGGANPGAKKPGP